MLVFAFRSEIWMVQNFNFTVFEDFCLSLSWKYRFLQNVKHAKVQSKAKKYCKFHVDLTRRRLSKSQFKKLGMVSKKLYRNTLIRPPKNGSNIPFNTGRSISFRFNLHCTGIACRGHEFDSRSILNFFRFFNTFTAILCI